MKSKTFAAYLAGISMFSACTPLVMAAPVAHSAANLATPTASPLTSHLATPTASPLTSHLATPTASPLASHSATPVASTSAMHTTLTLATHATTVSIGGKKLMTVNCTVASDPSSGRPTSWISAMNIQSILQQLGIDTHFVPGMNQLSLNMPLGYTLPTNLQVPYHAPKQGQFVIFVNSKSIAYPPTLGTSAIPDLPVYYIMKVLRALGVNSRWTGSAWQIMNKVQVPASGGMSGDVSKTFLLTLSNPGTGPATHLPPLPVPAPPPVTVKLPMNALLTPTSQALAGASESMPAQDYVQTGRATYIVNRPIAQVEDWFKAAYTAQGFSATGSGASGDFKTGAYVESEMFAPTTQQPGQDEQITMSYEALGANQTEVEYWVYDTVIPARPSSSQVATGATSLDVKISSTQSQGSGSAPTTKTYTVSNAQSINAVIAAINGLTTIDPPGITSGGPAYNDTSTATLTFSYPDGQTTTVTATMLGSMYGAVTVDGIPLSDAKGTVWAAVQKAIQ
jgi:hypothetical protein